MKLFNPVNDIRTQASLEHLDAQMTNLKDSVVSQLIDALEASKPQTLEVGQIAQLVHIDGKLIWELVGDPNQFSQFNEQE